LIAVIALAAGCRLHFDDLSDASAGDGDAALGPWGAPRALTELNGPNTDEFGPWLSDDRLELYFSSNLSGISRRLYRARRSAVSDPFGAPTEILVGMTSNATDPFVTDDGLSLYYSDNAGVSEAVYVATRATTVGDFSNPQVVSELDYPTSNDDGPALSSDELTIVFHSQRLGDADLFISTRPSKTSTWSPPMLLDGVSSPMKIDCCGWLSGDASALWFASDTGSNRTRLYIAQRIGAGFGSPALLDSMLDTGGDNIDPTLTRDQRTIVFAASLGGAPYDLYIADR
jgi:hypothetical protein